MWFIFTLFIHTWVKRKVDKYKFILKIGCEIPCFSHVTILSSNSIQHFDIRPDKTLINIYNQNDLILINKKKNNKNRSKIFTSEIYR